MIIEYYEIGCWGGEGSGGKGGGCLLNTTLFFLFCRVARTVDAF